MNQKMDYTEFLRNKTNVDFNSGFAPVNIPDFLFDFQKSLLEWSIKKGRGALFADCGLGKSPMELVWGQNIVEKTNGNVLLLTPLAVGIQMEKEAAKFGIEAKRSRDGKIKSKITIANYEILHYFDYNDFEAVICDECFAPDTKVKIIRDKNLQVVNIKDCKKNDAVINCTGIDKIISVKERKVKYAIEIGFNGQKIISSPNHPYFTQRGWVSAKEIQKDDFIVSSDKAMRILRGEFPYNLQGGFGEKILRDILLSEMEDEATGNNKENTQPGSCEKERVKEKSMVPIERSEVEERDRTYSEIEPDEKPRNTEESFYEVERDKTPTFHSWGKWSRDDISTAIDKGCFVRRMDSGICYISGETTKGLPDKLQSRLGEFRKENCNRSGWELSLLEKRQRQEEGRKTGFFGVESFEVLEQRDNRLDKYRDESGALYFYDLEIERHPSFTVNDCLVHNSSILKNFKGHRKKEITIFMRKVNYRLLATATAAPNDFIELGTSSEALGYLGHMDMLGKFFVNDQNNCATNRRGRFTDETKWRLKNHAHESFWKWVTSWARAVRFPSDIGHSDDGYILPGLIENDHEISVPGRIIPGVLPGMEQPAVGPEEQRQEVNSTINERCEKAAEIALSVDDYSTIWCNRNSEGDLLQKLIPGSVQVSGKDNDESKEEKLTAFSSGEIKKLITKPKIGAWGLNWQHCNHIVFFPTYSYEQKYQAVRRSWRFGQKRNVVVDNVYTEGQKNMVAAVNRKRNQADEMFMKLVQYMNESLSIDRLTKYDKKMEVPKWL